MTISQDPRFEHILEVLRQEIPQNLPVYLVGGAVRDLLRGQPVHDLDLVLPGDVRPIARRVADALNGSYYLMDEERNVARVVHYSGAERFFLDFCSLRGRDLETDLRERDFTMNAMALNLRQMERLVDPTGGAMDLKEKQLRACGPAAMRNDPIRVLRGVRLALSLNCQIQPGTLEQMRQAALMLGQSSAERQRDELFRILEGRQVHSAVRLLDLIGALSPLLPELAAMKGVAQSVPHTLEVWEHTVALLRELERVWAVLVDEFNEDTAANLVLGQAVLHLGRFRGALAEHFKTALNPNRSIRGLLFLAALYHDVAKPQTLSLASTGQVRFLGHEERGAAAAARRARSLALSQVEVQRLETVVRQHMRIHSLVATGKEPTRRAVFHYFRDCGLAGIDLVLLSLADTLATYGPTLPMTVWEAELKVAQALLTAWFDTPEKIIRPPRLISGSDLMKELNLKPGPEVGRLLAAIEEAQVEGNVTTRAEALEYARRKIS